MALDLTSIASRRAGSLFSHKHSLLTYDRAQSLLGFGGAGGRYAASHQSGMSFIKLTRILEYNEDIQGKEDAAAAEMMVIERPRSWT